MEKIINKITIHHEQFGMVLNTEVTDDVQFKLFLKMINGSIVEKLDFTYFDGKETLIHIPHKHLINCVITTNQSKIKMSEVITNRSKNTETV